MTAAISEAGPWLLLIAVLYGCYRWSLHRDAQELDAEQRYRARMAERYWRMEFDCEPLEPRVYDWQEEDAA